MTTETPETPGDKTPPKKTTRKLKRFFRDQGSTVPSQMLGDDTNAFQLSGDAYLGVTLLVGGRLISGKATSVSNWLKVFDGQFPNSRTPGQNHIEEEYLKTRKKIDEANARLQDDDDDFSLEDVPDKDLIELWAYSGSIWLIDVSMEMGSRFEPIKAPMLIRYKEIQGFFYGTVTT